MTAAFIKGYSTILPFSIKDGYVYNKKKQYIETISKSTSLYVLNDPNITVENSLLDILVANENAKSTKISLNVKYHRNMNDELKNFEPISLNVKSTQITNFLPLNPIKFMVNSSNNNLILQNKNKGVTVKVLNSCNTRVDSYSNNESYNTQLESIYLIKKEIANLYVKRELMPIKNKNIIANTIGLYVNKLNDDQNLVIDQNNVLVNKPLINELQNSGGGVTVLLREFWA